MSPHRSLAVRALLSATFLTLLLAGCGGEPTPYEPTAGADLGPDAATPAGAVAQAGLDAFWPSEDGRSWRYTILRYAPAAGGNMYGPPLSMDPLVPAAPSPEAVVPYLHMTARGSRSPAMAIPADWVRDEGTYTLTFTGTVTAPSGATFHNLTGVVDYAQPAAGTWVYGLPRFLHGGSWERTDAYIGTAPEPHMDGLAWKFLDAELKPGSEFTFVMSRPGEPERLLRALVLPRNLQDRLSAYKGEIEVVYVADYGVRQWYSDPPPTFPLYYRAFEYGSVTYAPGVGPVRLIEHRASNGYAPGRLAAPGHITTRLEATLQQVTPGPPPMAAR